MMRDSALEVSGGDGGEPDTGQNALIDALAQSAFLVMAVLTRIAAEHDLSLTQLRVLGILRDRRPRMAQLADFLGLDRSTMSGLIERAEKRGLIARARSAGDRRAIEVLLTDAGRELAEQGQVDVRLALSPVVGRLSTQQKHALTRALRATLTST